MRILIPAYCFEDCFVDNVQQTLEVMGHEVRTLGSMSLNEYWNFPRYAARVTREMLFGSRPDLFGRRVIRAAKEFRPDVVLSATGLLHPEVLEELGKLSRGRRILWWGDPPANSTRWGILDPGWDWVYLKDRAAESKLRLAGVNAHVLHEAMNPMWHRPVSKQKNSSIAVAGNYYAFRQAIILRLIKDGTTFDLYGPQPPRWANSLIKSHYTGRYLVKEEKSVVFGEAAACLNTFSLAEGDSLNCRAFEIAGAGGLQLVEHRSVIEECFEPGKELLVFKAYEELLEFIDRARRYPQEMVPIRESGARRAVASHTYKHRLSVILGNLS